MLVEMITLNINIFLSHARKRHAEPNFVHHCAFSGNVQGFYFAFCVVIDGVEYKTGIGKTKKEARLQAAILTLQELLPTWENLNSALPETPGMLLLKQYFTKYKAPENNTLHISIHKKIVKIPHLALAVLHCKFVLSLCIECELDHYVPLLSHHEDRVGKKKLYLKFTFKKKKMYSNSAYGTNEADFCIMTSFIQCVTWLSFILEVLMSQSVKRGRGIVSPFWWVERKRKRFCRRMVII